MEGWPVTLHSDDGRGPAIILRPLRIRDRTEWQEVRRDNQEWLAQWEPTSPDGVPRRIGFRQYVRRLRREAREGRTLPLTIEVEGRISGQMHLFGIARGSLLSGSAGYWVAKPVAGQGVGTRALAMLCDHAFEALALHRVEVNIRPENVTSLRLVEHLRFRDEGVRRRFLHIDGAWRDHRTFALTREDLAGGTVASRWAHE